MFDIKDLLEFSFFLVNSWPLNIILHNGTNLLVGTQAKWKKHIVLDQADRKQVTQEVITNYIVTVKNFHNKGKVIVIIVVFFRRTVYK